VHVPADWQMAQQRPATSSPTDHSVQRKRCRMDQHLHEGLLLPPPSQLISSARDPMTPNVNIVVRMPTAALQQSVDSSADKADQRLTHTLAGQSRGGVGLHQNPLHQGVGVREAWRLQSRLQSRRWQCLSSSGRGRNSNVVYQECVEPNVNRGTAGHARQTCTTLLRTCSWSKQALNEL